MLSFLKYLFRKNDNLRPDLHKAEVRRLEKALNRWVEEKRYRDCCIDREEIALQLNTSRAFLNIYFTQVLKVDFNTWRTRLRIEDAKKALIDHRELPINIVGEMVGFSDRSNFHRQFTKIVGCSPRQWRDSTENCSH